jgi:hypothetical protein
MSVTTFHCPQGPFELDGLGNEIPLLEGVSLTPYTARQLLIVLSLHQSEDIYMAGVLEPGDIPPAIRRIVFMLNTPAARKPFLRRFKTPLSPRVIDCPDTGLTRIVRPPKSLGGEPSDSAAVRRLEEVLDLLTQALEFECSVHWG